jgi:hypothetical protein
MSAVMTYPDSEQAVRLWLRTVIAATTARVDFGAGTDYQPDRDGALITLGQAGGGPDPHTPTDLPVISFTVTAAKKKQAAAVRTALLNALHTVRNAATAAGTVADARVVTCLWRPDPATGTPRYIVDALIAVKPTVGST